MKVTEQSSNYANLDKMSTAELLQNMNNEDKKVPVAVENCIPQIEKLVDGIVERMKKGGRLFYLGAGTSGRLGIFDASEIPPTYGAPFDLIIGGENYNWQVRHMEEYFYQYEGRVIWGLTARILSHFLELVRD